MLNIWIWQERISWVLRDLPAAFCGFDQALCWQVQSCLLLLNWRGNKANRSLKIAQCAFLSPRACFSGPRIPHGLPPPLVPSLPTAVPPSQARPAPAPAPPCPVAYQYPGGQALPSHSHPFFCWSLFFPSTWLLSAYLSYLRATLLPGRCFVQLSAQADVGVPAAPQSSAHSLTVCSWLTVMGLAHRFHSSSVWHLGQLWPHGSAAWERCPVAVDLPVPLGAGASPGSVLGPPPG